MPTVATAIAPTPASTTTSAEPFASQVIELPKTAYRNAIKALSGRDVDAAKRALGALEPAVRERIFGRTLPKTKLVPVVDAAYRGVPELIPVYAGMGAALNVADDSGLNAIFAALFDDKYDAAKYLLDRPEDCRERDAHAATRFTADDVEKRLNALGPKPTYEQVNEARP